MKRIDIDSAIRSRTTNGGASSSNAFAGAGTMPTCPCEHRSCTLELRIDTPVVEGNNSILAACSQPTGISIPGQRIIDLSNNPGRFPDLLLPTSTKLPIA